MRDRVSVQGIFAGGRARVLAAALVLVCLVVAALSQTPAGKRVASHLGLYAPSQPFTALSFTGPALIAQATEGRVRDPSRLNIGFEIDNNTQSGNAYRWRILAGPVVAAHGTTQLAAMTSGRVSAWVATGCRDPDATVTHGRFRATRVKITVELAPSSDRLDFWLACNA